MINEAIKFSVDKVEKAMEAFKDCFPAEESRNYVYLPKDGYSWTEGFWSGMLWLSYEFTEDKKFHNLAIEQLKVFEKRLNENLNVDNHDLGFLYTLSCVAAYKVTGNEKAKEIALRAADRLKMRFHERGQFIQAWGSMDGKENYRLIIDCLLNIPLLYWASQETGDEVYAELAKRHLKTSLEVAVREDYTTFHTFYFHPQTGERLYGVTHQGYSNDSCWARGQSWAVYGIALSFAYTKDERLIPIFNGVTECFLSRLPEDHIPYWDMIFTSGDEPRDTSAAVIAACGILEMNRHIPNERFMKRCMDMLKALYEKELTTEHSNGILKDAMYSKPHGSKSECNIWGDYFFMEAIMRLKNPDWKMYW